ncbi:MAG: amidohydrolase family protein [Thermoplasmataceae archaeon]
MASILIKNALTVTQDAERNIRIANILIEGNRISGVNGKTQDADRVIDATGMIAIPGLINTHAHVAMSHLKGKLDDISLESFLEKTFSLDGERTESGIYNSSRLGIDEMITNGITSFADLYYSEDVISKAVEDSGIRGFLSWNTLDEEFTTQKGNPVKNADHFISTHSGRELVYPSVGVQGIYVSSDENYFRVREVAERHGTIIHTHLAETRKEVYDYVRKSNGKRPTEHLNEIGFLNPKVLAAHSVWVTLSEIRQMARNSVKVSWNSISNGKLGVGGIAPVPEMLESGITVSVGTDSSGSNNSLDMFEAMKFSALWIKNDRWDPAIIAAQTILDMCTVNAAKALDHGDLLGSIEQGKLADIVLIDSRMPNLMPTKAENAVSNIVYSANPSNVKYVLVNGSVLKDNGALVKPFAGVQSEQEFY